MRLSRLHINGFKSFPDRSELGFDHGVTAIVGPNGCGKSNVVDAITWVLGEQSAKSLRGERMEDVIFNGSDARKPTAAAEVRLSLTNVVQAATKAAAGAADDDPLLDEQPLVTRDVEIGRRLYRSGESEYLIDGEVCRLRDVHDLLMDSGLGVKAYAVIEQGKIGQILSSRPAERRTLIEEAAGVTKYKSRRRAAELKLEAAQQNLTRIDDIIYEVEKQRGALKRQAARARRYKRLREELRRWEQVQFARRHEALSRDIDAAEATLQDARARDAAAAAHLAELEVHLEALRLELTEAEGTATATREQAHARELEIGRGQQQILFEQQQIEELARQAEAFASEARDLEERRGPARLAIETHRESSVRVRSALQAAAHRVDVCEREYSATQSAVQQVEQEADAMRASVLAAGTTLSALRQARDNAAAVRDRVAAERERLDLESRELHAEAERAREEGGSASLALERERRDLAAAARARTAAESDLAGGRQERERVAQALTVRQRDLAGREARWRSLEELDASRATYGDAARFLLAEGADALRQHGAVADHLEVTRTFERAVDALLGDLLQHVLVERADQVSRALAVLAGKNVGRCGFVVLDGPVVAAASATLEAPTGARTLKNVVRARGAHADIVAQLLGDALIVEDFDTALELSRHVSVPVASLTGEVFRGARLVEGGSRRDALGILEMRAEIARLRDEVSAGEAAAAAMAAEVSALDRSIAKAEIAATVCVEDLHRREKVIVSLEAQAARAAEEHARVSRRLDVVTPERRRAADEEQTAEVRREETVAAIATHDAQQQVVEATLGGVLARLQAAREDAEGRMRLVTQARTEEAGLAERASALDAEAARLDEAARDLETRVVNRQADTRRTETRREDLRASVRETERQLDEDVRAIDGLKDELRRLDERAADLRASFAAREHDIRAARHDLEAIRAHVMQFEVARARAAADLDHLALSCVEAVNASLDEVVAEVARMEREGELAAPSRRLAAAAGGDEEEDEGAEPTPVEAAGGEDADLPVEWSPETVIADLRRKVERLGPVNMMAIEQFDELESRHTFLTTQRKDLLDSIAQTGEAIRKIDKTTRERFGQAFESINVHFQLTFTTLFGGGRAGLVLIDQANDPESGIDIIAQPPGKRLQNVQLLSGGEKALTAMALMFAIFRYRPSPFCLLDEIDAPLDEANIGRFVEMLQGLQGHTQFILITHNRKTMEIADRLYGVTMEEPGVSKLISLQLN
jgi:chromosome segregation protein